MGKRSKRPSKKNNRLSTPDGPESVRGRQHRASTSQKAEGGKRAVAPFKGKRPVLRFVVTFGVLMILFYAAYYTPRSISAPIAGVFDTCLDLYTKASAKVLGVLGNEVHVAGTTISSARFSVQIVRGCDAVEATALYVCAVIAFPVSWRRKPPGILGGVLLLVILNIIRIVSLYYIGIHFPNVFRALHIDVWQPVFILVAVVLWLVWAWWATRIGTAQGDVST